MSRIACMCLMLVAAASAAFPVRAARPDPAVYPTANHYRDPAIAASADGRYAKVLREFCPGGGRGLIHFLDVDGHPIRVKRTWPTYLELAPGPHRLTMEFKGTASSVFAAWEGVGDAEAVLEPGKVYLVRYARTATDRFRVWLEPADIAFDSAGQQTNLCLQAPFPDPALHH